MELVKARAEYAGATRELDSLRSALRNVGGKDGKLQDLVGAAEERVANAAARVVDVRLGRR